MCMLRDFTSELYKHLTGADPHENSKIIRVHTRKLDVLGDLSFPGVFKNWYHLVDKNKYEGEQNLFSCLSCESTLIESSRQWSILISKVVHDDKNVALHFDKQSTFRSAIRNVLHLKAKYGCNSVQLSKRIVMNFRDLISNNLADVNLSELKLNVVEKTVAKLLQFTNNAYDCERESATIQDNSVQINFSLKSATDNNTVFCGAVLGDSGSKDFTTTAEEFISKRTMDMRLMAEHKYGLRVTANIGWKEFFRKLGESAVILHLLENKPQHTTTVNLKSPTSSNKGAPFILYNCARLSTLLKEFDKKVLANVYPPLPLLDTVTFDLLSEPEEWELLFVYILQFPLVIRDCIKDVETGRVNPHYMVSFLHRLASTFSVYYRRVRILTEPREHLYPVLHERIYLLKALEQVLHNSLYVLNIEPVKQM